MNKDEIRQARIEKTLQEVANHKCPICNQKVNLDDFRDMRALKEFTINGLCQGCQDKILVEDPAP